MDLDGGLGHPSTTLVDRAKEYTSMGWVEDCIPNLSGGESEGGSAGGVAAHSDSDSSTPNVSYVLWNEWKARLR